MNWNYKQPVTILFGNGRLSELLNYTKNAARPLVVSTPYFVKNGLAEKLSISTGAKIFSDFSENPDVEEVNRCSELIKEHKIDLIIAIGGGSAMDLSKAASVMADDITDYHGTGKAVPEKHLPLIAIPTTSGTGSEITNVAVLTNRKTGAKIPVVSDSFYPAVAIVDPTLTLSAPLKVTASAGIDVLCHALEGYWSKGHQPICDALAIHAIKLVQRYLPEVCSNPDNLESREKMAEASLIAGLAFAHPKTTSSHACSFPLTSIYHIPHGEACGLTLDYFARLNAADPRTENLAAELGFEHVDALADEIYRLKKETGLRTDLKDLRLSAEDIDELVTKSHHPNLYNNPVEITDQNLYDLYNNLK